MKVNSFDPNQPEKKIEKRKNEESGFKNCVWDQSGDGYIASVEAENAGRVYFENELGELYKNNSNTIRNFWRNTLSTLDFSDQKNIKQNLDEALQGLLNAVEKTFGTNATEATNEEPVDENSGNLDIDHLAGSYREQQVGKEDNTVNVNTVISPIFQNFKSPSGVEILGDGRYKIGHIEIIDKTKNADRIAPYKAERDFRDYRSKLVSDLNKYLAMQNGELEKDNNFMTEFEKRYQEAVGYGYFEDKSL